MVRRLLFWSHLIVGTVFGLFIAFMAGTGCILSFQRLSFDWAERGIQALPGTATHALPVEDLVRRAQVAEHIPPPSITISSEPFSPVVFQTGRFTVLYLNPYNGAVLGHGAVGVRNFFATVEGLHRWFGAYGRLRNPARSMKAAVNLGLLFLLLSGLVLWLPKKFTRKHVRPIVWPKRGLKGRAKNWNWHNSAGVWFAFPLSIIVLTGTVLSYDWANNLLFRATGNVPSPPDHKFDSSGATRVLKGPTPWQPLLARAEMQVPGWRTITMDLPDDPRVAPTAAVVSFTIDLGNGGQVNKQSRLILRQQTGEVVEWIPFASENLGQRLRDLARWTHTGESAGVAGQVVAVLASLGALLLVWTGFSLALHRLFAWSARRRRARSPTARGVRALPEISVAIGSSQSVERDA
jgi:uncharacterized iron-regulated membrane protein